MDLDKFQAVNDKAKNTAKNFTTSELIELQGNLR
jgi:hypothetical protein